VVELRALRWCVAGTALAFLNPLGPRLVLFPLQLVTRTAAFAGIAEWQPPNFDTVGQKFFLLQLFVAVLLLVRRPSYRAALPLAVFGILALTSVRNMVPASLILLPGMAVAAGRAGTLDGRRRAPVFTLATALVLLMVLPLGAVGLSGPSADLKGYPVKPVHWLDRHGQIGLDVHLVTRDFVANYLEVRYGPGRVRVFVDDRVDMYPLQVSRDYLALLNGDAGWNRILAHYGTDVVLWSADRPLAQLLDASPDWRLVYRDHDWVVAVPRGSPVPGDI
jgi:hypothetical protein